MPTRVPILRVALFVLLTSAIAVTPGSSRSKLRPRSEDGKARHTKYAHWPIAENTSTLPLDSQSKQEREAKSNRYNDPDESSLLSLKPSELERVTMNHWWLGLGPLPTRQSKVVVLCTVLEANAFLSGDKTNIYSEFLIQAEEVLLGDTIVAGQSFVVEREGGLLRLASGKLFRREIRHQDLPAVGSRYVLFLDAPVGSHDLHILTGYEIKGGRVTALDGEPGETKLFRFRAFDGYAEQDFLEELRLAINTPGSGAMNGNYDVGEKRGAPSGSDATRACVPAGHDLPRFSWKEGAAVRVYVIQSDFTMRERDDIVSILKNWFEGRGTNPPLPVSPPYNCSDVRFEIHFVAQLPTSDKNHLRIKANDLGPITETTQHLGEAALVPLPNNKNLKYATVKLNSQIPDSDFQMFQNAFSHEIGHTFGLLDCIDCGDAALPQYSIMDLSTFNVPSPVPGDCDQTAIRLSKPYRCSSQRYSSDWSDQSIAANFTTYPVGGAPNDLTSPDAAWCGPVVPIVVDVANDGFTLTSAANGVLFDVGGDGVEEQVAWTTAGDDDAWLVFDRNDDGVIDYGTELFSNLTPQTATSGRSGFLALAEFDKAENGGNADGKLSGGDAVYANLYLWRDTNHDGISDSGELYSLSTMNLAELTVSAQAWGATDQYGNVFQHKVVVSNSSGQSVTLSTVKIRVNAQ